jgi:hypothetical protein
MNWTDPREDRRSSNLDPRESSKVNETVTNGAADNRGLSNLGRFLVHKEWTSVSEAESLAHRPCMGEYKDQSMLSGRNQPIHYLAFTIRRAPASATS